MIAAAVYGLEPAREEREGQIHPAAHPFSWEEGLWHTLGCTPCTAAPAASPHHRPLQLLLPWSLITCLVFLCLSVCPSVSSSASVPVSRPHVPACTCSPVCVSPAAPVRVLLSGTAQVSRGCLHIYVHLCFSTQLRSCTSPCVRLPAPACVFACICTSASSGPFYPGKQDRHVHPGPVRPSRLELHWLRAKTKDREEEEGRGK